jgi:TRAP-type C4-dicarboxylate transport system substrate-binding protein
MMKKKGKLIFVVMLIGLVTLALLAGCGKSADQSGEAQKEALPQVIEINYSTTLPAQGRDNLIAMFNMIEEQSDGRIQFNLYWSSSLVPINEIPQALATGIADFAFIPIWLQGNVFPLHANVVGMPGLGMPSQKAATEIYKQLYNQNQAIRGEFEKLGTKLLIPEFMAPAQFHSTL